MQKQKKDANAQERSSEVNEAKDASEIETAVIPGVRELYQVVVVNYDRKEELTPILLTLATSGEEAESIIRHKLSLDWQKERLDFFVKLFKE